VAKDLKKVILKAFERGRVDGEEGIVLNAIK